MKKGIHPKYAACTVKCACGNTFATRATTEELKVDICNVCHPYYTGKQKFVDTAGRVQRFRERYAQFRAKKAGEPAS
jgi:large subunit ribosomal protein L31